MGIALAVAVLSRPEQNRHRQGAGEAFVELVEALGDRRLFEPRVSGGFFFGPLRSSEQPPVQDAALFSAANSAQEQASSDPSPQNIRALAAATLILGHASASANLLTRLTEAHPDDAVAWSDLAAARLVGAERKGRAKDIPAALEAATRALEIQPELSEALFNRALALRALNLTTQARQACSRLLAIDHSEWRVAAQRLGEELDAKNKSGGALPVEAVRLQFEAALRRLEGARDVAALESMGAQFRARTRDRSIEWVAAELVASPELGPVLSSYSRAREAYIAKNWSVAKRGFAHVLGPLGAHRSALAPWARLHLAIIDYQEGGVKTAARVFKALLAECADQPLLEGRIRWMLGLFDVLEGRFDSAERQFTLGKRVFSDADDEVNAAFMSAELAEVLDFLGRSDLAWAERLAALKALDSFPAVGRRFALLHASAARATDCGAPRAALDFLAEARATALPAGHLDDPELGLEQARAELSLGLPQSEATLLRQEALIQRVSDGILRERLLGEFYRVASGFPEGQSASIRDAIGRGVDWMRARRESAREVPLLVSRARSSLRMGHLDEAKQDFERAQRLLSKETESDLDLHLSRMALAGQALEGIIAIRLSEGADARELLARADRRWHLAANGSIGRTSAADVARLVENLRPESAVTGFLPLPQEMLSWCVTSEGVTLKRTPLSSSDLGHLLRAQSGPGLGRLLAVHGQALQRMKRLFVVASGPLTRAAWGAVSAEASGEKRWAIAIVPSLQYLLEHGARSEALPIDVLAVASPGSSGLPYLGRAEKEAEGVIQALGRGHLLAGPELTKNNLLASLGTVTAFHFAGHAIVNEERPGWSRLALGREGDDLFARDVWGKDLSRLRVVTLSACEAAADNTGFGQGGLSVAAAFLRAGAGAVVAPLEEIADDEAPRTMHRLYAALAHTDAARAVANLQSTDRGSVALSLVVYSAAGALRSGIGGSS